MRAHVKVACILRCLSHLQMKSNYFMAALVISVSVSVTVTACFTLLNHPLVKRRDGANEQTVLSLEQSEEFLHIDVEEEDL